MAGKKNAKDLLVCDCSTTIKLNGLISRQTCSGISIELIKYALFQKGQIPQPYDQIQVQLQKQSELKKQSELEKQDTTAGYVHANKSHMKNTAVSEEEYGENNDERFLKDLSLKRDYRSSGDVKLINKPFYVSPSQRKQQQSMLEINNIFFHIKKAFEDSIYPIRTLAFLLGSSIMTPKEIYCLHFPSNNLEGNHIPLESVKKTFFKELVLSDFIDSFGDQRSLLPQKMTVFIQTNRNNNIQWFYPNCRFKLSARGRQFHISILNGSVSEASITVSQADMMDISGVIPLDASTASSDFELSMHEQSFEQLCDSDELIWYQSLISFQGFR